MVGSVSPVRRQTRPPREGSESPHPGTVSWGTPPALGLHAEAARKELWEAAGEQKEIGALSESPKRYKGISKRDSASTREGRALFSLSSYTSFLSQSSTQSHGDN